jgi:hypothetical protein
MMDLSGVSTAFSNACLQRKNTGYCLLSKIIGDYVQLLKDNCVLKKQLIRPGSAF